MAELPLCGLSAAEISEFIESSGFTYPQAVAIANGIYKKRIHDFKSLRGIPSGLIKVLQKNSVTGITPPIRSQISSDGSVKYLFRNNNGFEFETVYIPEGKRYTLCVSTQSGCRMGCSFCETARYGFRGDLTVTDIMNQILAVPQSALITHVVFMGMGEPLDNLSNVLKACSIITSEWGLSLSSRNVTVSTVGIRPAIERFLSESNCNLAVSLYSPFCEERAKAIPVERIYPVKSIIDFITRYKIYKKRRISLAYIMIDGVNDSDAHLQELIAILKGSTVRLNLLPFHNIDNDNRRSSSEEKMQYFKHNLIISGVSASVRKSRGADISAACGLLASGLEKRVRF